MSIHWKEIAIGGMVGIVAVWTARNFVTQTRASRETQVAEFRIGDLAQRVRTELEQMEGTRLASGKDAVFQLKDFDLEISFVVKVNQKTKGEISTEVVTIGAEGESAREKTHKVTLHMTPIPQHRFSAPPTTNPIESRDAIELPAAEVN